MERSSLRSYFNRSVFSPSRITGLLLVITGIVFFYNPNDIRLKVGASMILLGLFFLLFLNVKEIDVLKTLTGQKLTFILVLWVFLGFIITYNFEANLFFIIIILGIIIIEELLSEFSSQKLKNRMTILVYFLIIAFLFIVSQKIISIIIR